MGLLNKRGRIQNEERVFCLTKAIYLTQEDSRQVQLASLPEFPGTFAKSMNFREVAK